MVLDVWWSQSGFRIAVHVRNSETKSIQMIRGTDVSSWFLKKNTGINIKIKHTYM